MMTTNIMKCKLVKDKEVKYTPIECASDVVKISNKLKLNLESEEVFYIFCLNSKGAVSGIHEVSRGDVSRTMVHPREVFKRALLNNASSIILMHNHPSGNLSPSKKDIELTIRLQEAGKILGVKVLDHIIIGDGSYSLASNGDINFY